MTPIAPCDVREYMPLLCVLVSKENDLCVSVVHVAEIVEDTGYGRWRISFQGSLETIPGTEGMDLHDNTIRWFVLDPAEMGELVLLAHHSAGSKDRWTTLVTRWAARKGVTIEAVV